MKGRLGINSTKTTKMEIGMKRKSSTDNRKTSTTRSWRTVFLTTAKYQVRNLYSLTNLNTVKALEAGKKKKAKKRNFLHLSAR
jgi:hypothetical protein